MPVATTPGRPRTELPARRRAGAAVALGAVLLLGATACSGEGAGSASGGSVAGSADAPAAAGAATLEQAAGTDAAAVGVPAADLEAGLRSVVSTGDITVEVADVQRARADVVALAASVGGLVTASSSGAGEGDDREAMTLRVPGATFSDVVGRLGDLGRQTALTTSATDVTAEVADVGSRVTSAQAVLATFRDRLPQATTIPDVLAVEGEIARRQADLEALQARQRALADSVTLATLQVTLQPRPPATAAAVAGRPGFLGGLQSGWTALGSAVRVAALLLGAVLPFALLAAVVVVPALVLRRRRTRATATPPASPAG
ncbi:DUF4349 domain-containing protein [Kineococcus rubinsiae]|uniref:DUF4349 domain-containing protein n=1 Tax=Kineococcus rubinsiae TaxID=2609562 RepID=UPI0014303EAB|nr:DUF4349 domain-containing protein [Kineococcus rubinsiae]